jgi:hypothetical protein
MKKTVLIFLPGNIPTRRHPDKPADGTALASTDITV